MGQDEGQIGEQSSGASALTPPWLRAGSRIAGDGGPSGTAGLLAQGADGRVYALTVSHVLPSHGPAFTRIGERRVRLGRAKYPVDCKLAYDIPLVMIAVPANIRVAPNAAGLHQAGQACTIFELETQTVYVHHQRGVSKARLCGFGMSRIVKRGDDTMELANLFEIELTGGIDSLGPGDAGALVATIDGRPLGLLIGGKGSIIYAAPLWSFMADTKLESLTAFIAERHNARSRKAHRPHLTQRDKLENKDETLVRQPATSSEALLLQLQQVAMDIGA